MLLTSTIPDLSVRLLAVRDLTERLAAPLSAEDQTAQSMTDASPTKWHRAHTSWFFEEFVLGPAGGYRVFDPSYRYLFNSYYEAVGPRHPRPQRGLVTRPGIAEIARYRTYVQEELVRLDLVELGCHHEQQHQELLLMDAKHLLAGHPFNPVYIDRAIEPDVPSPPLTWRRVDGGLVDIGHVGAVSSRAGHDGFAFDNEGPRHTVLLQPFEIAERNVTNADWLEFMADGGYDKPELWLSDGWIRRQADDWHAPAYWQQDDDGQWTTFTLSGRRPVRAGEPVCHVSFYEADAFAHWADARLPTEQEWETAARSVADQRGELLDPGRCHPNAATTAMIGDVWQWTASAYLPYPGFKPAAGAVGEYNGKFMCDQHVLRGASAVTPGGHERLTYRNFFPAYARWAFSGLRLARG
jgi:ergothioneine biosynthesis protein EgtB